MEFDKTKSQQDEVLAGETFTAVDLSSELLITPQKLSKLLLVRGPLAIRHINHAITEEFPEFQKLSLSKQRRLIMSALESGDVENSVVFEKVGWGQWSAKKVDPEKFDLERKKTNIENAVAKDSRTSSIGSNSKPSMVIPKSNIMYIDENAVATDEEEESNMFEDEDATTVYYNPAGFHKSYGFSTRRKSTVISGESSPETIENELLAQKIRPFFKRKYRRSSSTARPLQNVQNVPNNKNAANGPSLVDMEKQQAAVGKTDLPPRRESRLSVSKESSIRSTLFPHKNYEYTTSANAVLGTSFDELQSPLVLAKTSLSQNNDSYSVFSDTDEEDWASIGAVSLRNNRSTPELAAKVKQNIKQKTKHSSSKNLTISESAPQQPKKTKEDKNAAFLLMSLKS